MTPRFFRSADEFRRWLARHHATAPELWVGFYKKASGKPGLTYHEGVDVALCYGWIDGHKKRVDQSSYTHRFSPRRPGSIWSAINTRRATELERAGLMAEPGRTVFARRSEARTGIYTYENPPVALAPAYVRLWKADRPSWTFFEAQPPGYRKLATRWIMTAKQEATRRRRLQIMMDASAQQTRTRWT